jgi:PST family polysaccharide transporter
MIGWVAAGVALTMLAASQLALLNGLRKVGDIARLNIFAALLATVVGIAALLLMGERGLLVFVLAVPLCSFLIGAWLVRRLRLPSAAVSGADLMADARKLIGLGAAAWLISTVYLGAVLTAMTTDYYPRLTALADDPVAASALINDQTRMALWLCGPVCLGLIALAPLATLVLFSAEFTQSATILQWLVVGDVLKIMAWPLGFALLARNDGSRYLLVETTAIIVFASAVSVLLPVLDLVGTGAAFILMYCAYLPLVRLCLRRHLAFAWDREVKADAALLLGSAILTASLCSFDPVAGGALGLLLAAALGYRSWQRLRKLSGAAGWRALIRRRA